MNNEDEEISYLLNLAVKYGSTGWKDSDCAIVTATTKVVRAALKAAKKSVEWVSIDHCERALLAQARYRRKERASGSRPAQPVGLAVWLNQERWTLMCEPEKERSISKKCHCGADTHGPNIDECLYHINFTVEGKMKGQDGDLLREYAKTHDVMKMTRQESIDFIKQKLGDIGKTNAYHK